MPVNADRLGIAVARSRMHGNVEDAAFVRTIFSSLYRSSLAVILEILIIDTVLLHGLHGVMLAMSRWWRGGAILIIPLAHVIADAIEMVAQTCYARSGKDAKDVPLMLVEFWGSLATVDRQVFAKERLNASQA